MFDPEAFGNAMGVLIRNAVEPLERSIAELRGKLAEHVELSLQVERAVSDAVSKLPTPKDGKDAEPADVDAIVKQVLAQLPAPQNGQDGAPGENGKSVTIDDVRPFLEEALSTVRTAAANSIQEAIKAIPVPKDGKDGTNGNDGAPGEKGADGLGLAGAMIDRDGALQITLTNGEVKSLGVVVGKDGTDGADGLSLESFDMEYLADSHEVVLKAIAAGRTKEVRFPAGGIHLKGYWREGTRAKSGEAWVNDGSLWVAIKECQSKPGLNDDAWVIAARKGRDGENGRAAKPVDTSPIKLGN